MSVKLINIQSNTEIKTKSWTFNAGERNIKIVDPLEVAMLGEVQIYCKFKGSDDIMDIILMNDAINNISKDIQIDLFIPYYPYSRQDCKFFPT